MSYLSELVSAWHARDWYALVVVAVVALMRLATKTEAWHHVPRRLQWLPPVLMGAGAGLAGAYYEGAPWTAAALQALAAGLQIGLGAVGVHHALKRTSSGDGPPTLPTWPSLVVVAALSGCGVFAADSPGDRCSAEALAELESEYVLTVLVVCRAHETPEACPQYPQIRDRFAAQREEWIACR